MNPKKSVVKWYIIYKTAENADNCQHKGTGDVMIRHRHKRKDKDHYKIIKQLNELSGVKAKDISDLNEIGDILVGYKGKNYLIELKTDETKSKTRRYTLTDDEEKFHNTWTGQIDVAFTLEDILTIINWSEYA